MTNFLIRYVLLLACVGLSSWLIIDGQAQVATAKTKYDDARRELSAVQDAHQALNRLGVSRRKISEPETATEEARFLAGLRAHAKKQRASVTKLSSTTEAYREDPERPQNKELVGLTRVTSHLTVVGPYASLYKFLESISSSQRLYVFSDLKWSRDTTGNKLSVSITRYVQPSSENISQ